MAESVDEADVQSAEQNADAIYAQREIEPQESVAETVVELADAQTSSAQILATVVGGDDVAVLEAPAVATSDIESAVPESVASDAIDIQAVDALNQVEGAAEAVVEKPKKRWPVKIEPLIDESVESSVEVAAPVGWRAKAASLLAKALGREEAPKAAPKRKRAPRKKATANTDGVTAKPRAKRKPKAKVQPTVKKGLFGRVLARIGFGEDEPVATPKPRRRKPAGDAEGRTAPRKPRAASSKKRASAKKAPVKKGLFGRVMARFGLGEDEAPVKKPRVRKPVDPDAPKKPRKPRATNADGAPKKRAPRKKAASKSTLQRAVDSVVGGWRSLRGK